MIDPINGKECSSVGATQPAFIGNPNRSARLPGLSISRALPIRDRRLVGPWCFLDRFGPLSFTTGKPMNVPPHPHIGLQTVSWLLEGEVLHNDSLGSEAVVRPAEWMPMTAGSGISHSEENTWRKQRPPKRSADVGCAARHNARDTAPSFINVEQVPGGGNARRDRPGICWFVEWNNFASARIFLAIVAWMCNPC